MLIFALIQVYYIGGNVPVSFTSNILNWCSFFLYFKYIILEAMFCYSKYIILGVKFLYLRYIILEERFLISKYIILEIMFFFLNFTFIILEVMFLFPLLQIYHIGGNVPFSLTLNILY